MGWGYGDVIVRREIAWGRPWLAVVERVVEDTPDRLVTYIQSGAPMGYAAGPWPTANGLHPWYPKPAWEGHGTLVMQRPGDAYAVECFWRGPYREFSCWYVNLQAPMRRTPIGYDTDDHELDIVVSPDGRWSFKDDEVMEQRVREGRYSAAAIVEIRALGADLAAMIETGRAWWDPRYARWEPDPAWTVPELVAGWETVPVS
jgi:hypothetical protein